MSNDKITAAAREPYDAMGPIDTPNPPAARATLADVKPGGMVRLGDSLPPLPPEVDAVLCYYYTAEQMRDYARAALSAQPSPGGQGDAPRCFVSLDMLAGSRHKFGEVFDHPMGSFVRYEDHVRALAARQPVESEENVAADTYWTLAEMIEPHVQREGINPNGALPASVHDSVAILLEHWLRTRQPAGEPVTDAGRSAAYDAIDRFLRNNMDDEAYAAYVEHLEALWAAAPAQAVDLGPSIPSELAPVAAALKRFNECAEDCDSDGCDIGRDWFDALTTMGLLKRTQRSPAVWTMTAEGERLLALIDSHAVGK